jgi:thiamine-monophosphate kinase
VSGERGFLRRLAERLPRPPPGQTWVGDDAAVLSDGRLVASDLLVEGVHFRSSWASPADVGFKALAVNLSDLAAMGGRPESAVAAVALPSDRPGLADQLLDGLVECAERFACPLVGGDTSSGPHLVVAVTVTGHAERPILRSRARPGQTIFVTGPLGGAASVLARLEAGESVDDARPLHRPLPRLEEGAVAARAGATAMLDLSDGLAMDLPRIAEASRIGIRVKQEAVPIAAGATSAQALGGGDDYELCFVAADGAQVREAFASHGLREPVAIGSTTASGDVLLDGRPLEGGWEHDVS